MEAEQISNPFECVNQRKKFRNFFTKHCESLSLLRTQQNKPGGWLWKPNKFPIRF